MKKLQVKFSYNSIFAIPVANPALDREIGLSRYYYMSEDVGRRVACKQLISR